jgi:hypothetical protein
MADQLVTVEVTGLAVIATPQLVQLLAHGVEHGVVFVQRNLSGLEKTLRRVVGVCRLLPPPWGRASDLFTEIWAAAPALGGSGTPGGPSQFEAQGCRCSHDTAQRDPGQCSDQDQKSGWNHRCGSLRAMASLQHPSLKECRVVQHRSPWDGPVWGVQSFWISIWVGNGIST